MLVNTHSSNQEPNQEADRDPIWLSERDSLLCEQAPCLFGVGWYRTGFKYPLGLLN